MSSLSLDHRADRGPDAYRRRDAVAKERQALVGGVSALERDAFTLQGKIDLLEERSARDRKRES